jgi:serine/threonine protein kinase
MHAAPRIPGYELIQRLGGGPLTSVFSAREHSTDRSCAVKVIREDFDDQPTAVKLLQREARAGLAVRHPHLVQLWHTHVTRPPYFLVMELLPGESLRRRLRRDYRLDVATSLWVIRQTAEALAALHRAGFLHGDVKPENIRLVSDGTASLIDLGFAHRPGENRHFFQKGYVMGTANYLAPELCDRDPADDPRSDLFSLGVTFFELLTGQLPYRRGTIAQTFERHCSEAPDDIRDHVEGLPQSLVSLIGKLLAREPAERPRASFVVQQLIALEIAALRRRRTA